MSDETSLLCRKPYDDLHKYQDSDVVGDGQQEHFSILGMIAARSYRMIKIPFHHAEDSLNLPAPAKVNASS